MASTQEELGCRGAAAGVFSAAPEYCIALDVTFASAPDASGAETFEAGCGAVIDVGPNMNRRMSDALIAYCREKEIPVLSVPIRYMHSPVETVKLSDAETVVRLLTGFISDYFEGGVLHA